MVRSRHRLISADFLKVSVPRSTIRFATEYRRHQDVLKSGDIVNVDVSTIYNGYYADASRMFMIGKVDKKKQDLVAITKECLRRGLEAAQPWSFVGDIGAAVSGFAHKHGYSVVTEFGGHGVGIDFHEEPFICHVGKRKTGMLLVPA